MTRALDLSGQRFGSWTAVERAPASPRYNEAVWVCVCDCGTRREISAGSLKSGNSRSCGCVSVNSLGERSRTHGMAGTPEHACWKALRTRCYNEAFPAHKHYGGRGIIVCERWLKSFEAFFADMGPRPSANHSIERIDNNGPYEPGNCRWATKMEQVHNRRVSRWIVFRGERRVVADWARRLNISAQTIYHRLARGISDPEQVLSQKDERSS
jgi:hypothetical protein